MSVPPAVEVDGLVKRYGTTTAVDGLSVRVDSGAVTALLGPNGAGKTTTVETCEGFREPDTGRVRVLGLDPRRDSAELRPRVGVMLQEGAGLYPGAGARELLTHLGRLHRHPLDVDRLVERLGLGGTGRTPLRRLSGGQRQRVALAAALVGRPELVFLDEPTAGLDPHARHSTWDLIGELRGDGVSVVLTTHLIDEAEQLADHVVIIDHGRLVTEGSPEELTSGPGDDVISFGGPPRLDLSTLRAALPESADVREVTPGSYQVAGVVDPHLLATLTSWCATNDILAEGLQVGRRSLEDVYLELTRRSAR
ncbi:ABC-2 type transport system ATP-binding protein [Haloactinopolyspora alba]|uniref:ABC-2 type transport system ATP-binding protein n=1 Tax=Haloactinopolyspora alba TaxID=648780 RepID=A0A2P8E3I8_9ACTN|nr:ABC transporter ATP-binding protein [Haloactinopolyspora alba]PSL04031.1 ABC-2 type transport system ATP-binding protein [Haloactinopolyspora alba]